MKKTLEELVKERDSIIAQINAFIDDKFFYYVVTMQYGSCWVYIENNIQLFKERCESYWGDNGFSYGYSNNPKVKRKQPVDDSGCSINYIKSIDNIKDQRDLKEIKRKLEQLEKIKAKEKLI